MRVCTIRVNGISPYCQNKYIDVPKKDKEQPDDYEKRTCKSRLHTGPKGFIEIPAMAFKKSVESGSSFDPMKIKGQQNATYTKHFLAGILVMDSPEIEGVRPDDVEVISLLLPANGKKGSSSRVVKYMPTVPAGWKCTVRFFVLDDLITKEIFEKTFATAGQFIGIGNWRVQNGGLNGRFVAESFKWEENVPLSEAQ